MDPLFAMYFKRSVTPYRAGTVAGFTEKQARKLIDQKIAYPVKFGTEVEEGVEPPRSSLADACKSDVGVDDDVEDDDTVVIPEDWESLSKAKRLKLASVIEGEKITDENAAHEIIAKAAE